MPVNKAAVLGQPIGHSKSPVLHRAAYALLGVAMDYQRIELDPSDAPDFAAGLRTGGWAGCSVTMPLKDVFVGQMDTLSPTVERMGALNTILVGADGALHGENTDIYGIVQAFRDAGVEHSPAATILGAGNTALAAVEALHVMGVRELDLVVRDVRRAQPTVDFARALGLAAVARPVGTIETAPVVVSTLPPGAADGWIASLGSGSGVLLDVAYDPWPSALAKAWAGPVVNGLAMLVHQAVEQVRLFTGLDFDERTRQDVTNAMFNAVGLHRGR
ncbi:shikimate dehydrogenase [Glutamicibacter sp. MNS18]|uniref:shikimate dehydrogenase family protein n=1 Tax=Glutamicibacter sp. MNS18 TaxID=2989817 RepID=UPI002236B8F9|nr:shikimate dehydrogenase [Glutamicibacter sp. MNS18]MCW4464791.1 shikimate dehydrogenase [Glutamicibacter sp. MNS18]